jgi:HEAT repeat protein
MRRVWVIVGVLVLAVSLAFAFIPQLRFWAPAAGGGATASGKPASYWVDAVRTHADAGQRAVAAGALAELGPDTPGATDALKEALKDPDGQVRAAAAGSLGQLKPAGKEVVDALHAVAKSDGVVQAKIAAIMALGGYGEAAADAIPTLVEVLNAGDTPNGSPHDAAVFALAGLCKDRLPVLVAALDRKEDRVRQGALQTLARIGPPATPALPAVQKVIDTGDPLAQLEAAQTHWRIEQKADPVLAVARRHMVAEGMERSKRTTVRMKAIYLLGELGGKAEPMVSDLIGLLKDDPETFIRRYSAMTLGKIGSTPAIVDALRAAGKTDKDPDVCWAANEQLRNLGVK